MFTILLDPDFFQAEADFSQEVERFIAYVKSSDKASPAGEILMPGEIEERTKENRLQNGIDLDDTTWGQIVKTCESLAIFQSTIDSIVRG
jgi:uncharacterized oxidoreductase